MEVKFKIDQEEYKKWHQKFTENSYKVISTPLPYEMRKRRINDKGYNRFSEIVNPNDPSLRIPKTHDPLLTKDIEGAVPNAFGKVKNIRGRDYINITDMPETQPGYKIDKFCNK